MLFRSKIYFEANGLRPNTRLFAFFGNVSMADYVRSEAFVDQLDNPLSTDPADINDFAGYTSHPDGATELITDADGYISGSMIIPNNEFIFIPSTSTTSVITTTTTTTKKTHNPTIQISQEKEEFILESLKNIPLPEYLKIDAESSTTSVPASASPFTPTTFYDTKYNHNHNFWTEEKKKIGRAHV